MISYLEGAVTASDERSVIIQTDKIGWRVFLGTNTLAKVQKNKDLVKVFTHLYSRENSQELYGFENFETLKFFELLLGVSGVGPRHAQLVVDSLAIKEITGAVSGGASDVFMRIPGIGSKLAKKIIIELEPKVRRLGLKGEIDLSAFAEEDDAIEALRSLGYSQREAREALKKVPPETKGLSKRVEEALKILGKPRT